MLKSHLLVSNLNFKKGDISKKEAINEINTVL